MAGINMTKENFLSLLDQFSGDPVFQQQIIDRLFSKMPVNYRDQWIKEQFYEHVCDTVYYKLEHVTYPNWVYYYTSVSDIIIKLQEFNFNEQKLTVPIVNAHIQKEKPLCGFHIIRKEGNNK
jgi:hypothetical protein